MMSMIAILQARMSSTRLPGKILRPILHRPMLALQIERLERCRNIDRLVVATSDHFEDQVIVDLCRSIDVDCYSGDLDNVLDRFYWTGMKFQADHIVRLTGDCPLADPELIDTLITFYLNNDCDYASNCLHPTLPDGLDAEVVSFSALKKAWEEALLPSHLEHVTSYIIDHPEKFILASWKNETDLSHLRWTVDEEEDFQFANQVYELLYPVDKKFLTKDILKLLKKRPDLLTMNAHFKRNEGSRQTV